MGRFSRLQSVAFPSVSVRFVTFLLYILFPLHSVTFPSCSISSKPNLTAPDSPSVGITLGSCRTVREARRPPRNAPGQGRGGGQGGAQPGNCVCIRVGFRARIET